MKRFIAVCIAVLLCLGMVSPMLVHAAEPPAIDRNQYESDKPLGTNENIDTDKTIGSSSETSSEPEDTVDRSEVATDDELSQADKVKQNTNFVDTCIYFTGILIWIGTLIYITIISLAKTVPWLGEIILRIITFGKVTSVEDSYTKIFMKFVILAAFGTLFVGGYIKVLIAQLYGWLLSRRL